MRIVIVGASGTIGQAVAKELSDRARDRGRRQQERRRAGRHHRRRLDPRWSGQIGPFDALVSTAGKVKFGGSPT